MARITKTRAVQSFTEIIAQAYGDVVLEQGETEGVVVEADERMMPKLKTSIRDGRLFLGFRYRWWEWITWWWTWLFIRDKRIHYRVSLRDFRGVSISASGNVTAEQLRGDECQLRISGSGRVQVEQLTCQSAATCIGGSGVVRIGEIECQSAATRISGSGDVSLAGKAKRHEIRISGSGRVNAPDFETGDTKVVISGSGKATLNALQTLNVRVSGSGSVNYRGRPQISQHISGRGRVQAIS